MKAEYDAEATALREARVSLGVALGSATEVLIASEAVANGAAMQVDHLMKMVGKEGSEGEEEKIEKQEEEGKEGRDDRGFAIMGNRGVGKEEDADAPENDGRVVDEPIAEEEPSTGEEDAVDEAIGEQDDAFSVDNFLNTDNNTNLADEGKAPRRKMSEITSAPPKWVDGKKYWTFSRSGTITGSVDVDNLNDDDDDVICIVQFLKEADEHFLDALIIREASMEEGVSKADESLEMAGNGLTISLKEDIVVVSQTESDTAPFLLRLPISASGNRSGNAAREPVLHGFGAGEKKLAPMPTSIASGASNKLGVTTGAFLETKLSLKFLANDKYRIVTIFPVFRLRRDVFTLRSSDEAHSCVSSVDSKVALDFRRPEDAIQSTSGSSSTFKTAYSFSSSSTQNPLHFGFSIVSSDAQTLKDFSKTRLVDGVVKGEILAVTPIVNVDWSTTSSSDWLTAASTTTAGTSSDWLLEASLPMPPNPITLKRLAEERAQKEEWLR